MWKTRQRIAASVLVIAVLVVLTLAPSSVVAAPNLPGGGPSASDCFVEFDVGQATFTTKGSTTKINCTECDPTCDTDASKDGKCVFRFGVCPKQGGIATCKPSTTLRPIRITGATPVGTPVSENSSSCVTYEATARTKKRLHGERAGRQTIKVKVSSTAKPKLTDQDTIIYACVPRTGACPVSTTTSTVTTTTTTTTLRVCGNSAPQCDGPCPMPQVCIPNMGSCVCSLPSSRLAAKTDVRYLDKADVKRLHDELLGFRLARWRYRSEEAAGSPHLGFLIDDVEPSAAVSAAHGDTVDLYGYASMAVAAIQMQAREIEQLKREVALLRRQQREAARAPDVCEVSE
jgi:hypothetical protein